MKLPVYDEVRENVAGGNGAGQPTGRRTLPMDVAVQRGRILARKVGFRDVWMV
jgi:hypothetical protein